MTSPEVTGQTINITLGKRVIMVAANLYIAAVVG